MDFYKITDLKNVSSMRIFTTNPVMMTNDSTGTSENYHYL